MSLEQKEQDERAKVFENRIIYSLPVHLGYWTEDLALKEEKIRRVFYKRDNCLLSVQNMRKMFRNILKSTTLAPEAPFVLYGQNYQLKASDLKASKNSTGLYLSGIINEREIETVQHFKHGCSLNASTMQEPCVRNTFKIIACDGDKNGRQVFYGEDVFIQIIGSENNIPLYLQSKNPSMDNFCDHLTVELSAFRDIYCRFVILNSM